MSRLKHSSLGFWIAVSILGLCVAGTTAFQSQGQQGSQPTNPRRGALIGTIDLDRVLKNYQRAQMAKDELETLTTTKQAELETLVAEQQVLAKQREAVEKGTPDWNKLDNQLIELSARLRAADQTSVRELQARESQLFAAIFENIQSYTKDLANHYGMKYVLQKSSIKVDPNDPMTLRMATAQPLIYSDESVDLTDEVIDGLNRWFLKELQRINSSNGTPAVTTPPGSTTPRR